MALIGLPAHARTHARTRARTRARNSMLGHGVVVSWSQPSVGLSLSSPWGALRPWSRTRLAGRRQAWRASLGSFSCWAWLGLAWLAS